MKAKLTDNDDSLIFCSTISRAQNPSSRKVKSKSSPVKVVIVFVQDLIAKETVQENDSELQNVTKDKQTSFRQEKKHVEH